LSSIFAILTASCSLKCSPGSAIIDYVSFFLMTSRFRKLVLQIIVAILGIWLATELIDGVEFTGSLKTLCYAGLILGFINFFIKPILNLITLPLRMITFGLFSLVINMGIVWLIEIIFPQLEISGIYPLFWTTITVWALSLIASRI